MPYRSTARTEAHRLDTRSRIVTVALGLIAADGYQSVTMAAVAEAAGVGVGTVYRQFPSKPELFIEAYRVASHRELDVIARAADADLPTIDRIALAVRDSASRALTGRTLGRALLVEPADPLVEAERQQFRATYRDLFAALVADGIERGELPRQDPVLSATALMGVIVEVLFGPISPLDRDTGTATQKIIDALVDFCRKALYYPPAGL